MDRIWFQSGRLKVTTWKVAFLATSLLALLGVAFLAGKLAAHPPDTEHVAADKFRHLQIQTAERLRGSKNFPWGYVTIPGWAELYMQSEIKATSSRFEKSDLVEFRTISSQVVSFACPHIVVSDELIESLPNHIKWLEINASELTSKSYKNMRRFQRLESLELNHFQCSDAELAMLLKALKPQYISLSHGKIGLEALTAMSQKPAPSRLSLRNVRINDLMASPGTTPFSLAIQSIDLIDCDSPVNCAQLLAKCPRLLFATLEGEAIEDSLCQTLAAHPSLLVTTLNRTNFTDQGISELLGKSLTLRSLFLTDARLSPAVLDNVTVLCPTFAVLRINDTAPPESSVESFTQRNPSLRSLTLPLDTYSPEFIERVNSLLHKRGGSLENSWNHSAAIPPEAAPTTGVNEPHPAE